MTIGRISSPASTGQVGAFFEQHVGAYWLAQLLVGAIPPILHDCALVEVQFQTEHLGWHTDDFLIVGENGAGEHRKLVGQVKRPFTVSATDAECKKAVQDFWKDFSNPQNFSPAFDRLALVTLRGTNTLLEHFSGLLDCSRSARDGAEFESRLTKPGFISTKAVHYCNEIRTIINEAEGRNVSIVEAWPFLRVLHVLSLDLNTATRQTEAMIKTLLAHTAGGQDAIGTADASWNALLREVGEGMPVARGFRRSDLPQALLEYHSPVSAADQHALRALTEHSALILGGICSTIGSDLHLARARLVQQLIQDLDSTQVVLVSGAAGSGKSVVAKDAIGILTADHFAFTFRAEELAQPHFDMTLQSNRIPANAAMLGAILASQDRKILLVESVERLLEKSAREAFDDLLTLVARDRSWRLVLTCRGYAADLVRSCFLESKGIGHCLLTIPPLDDGELAEVEHIYPALARPLASATLRRILRTPYALDKALLIPWSAESPLPQSKQAFRALFWREIVRVDHDLAGGMPKRRADAFVEIALRRARALTPYAACGNLDPEVIDRLRRDSLIVSSRHSDVLLAPAHDVLEDWAILQWINEQHWTHQDSAGDLSAAIGTHPAVRRTYRNWVTELVECDQAAADRLFEAALRETALPPQFSDDTLVSLLRSTFSAPFLERHSAELLANDKRLLLRIIHLLRVACVTTAPWFRSVAGHASSFNVPDGPAWASVLRLVATNLQTFAPADGPLLLGFIEDWARGVSSMTPYPEGAEYLAVIAHWLLPSFDGYRSERQLKRTLHVIAKIPNADSERFATLLQRNIHSENRDRLAEEFRGIIFEGPDGMAAARDQPDLVVSVAKDYVLCSDVNLRGEWGWTSDLRQETLFGIKHGRSRHFFPASAYRGPFLPLLRHHPNAGTELIVTVLNHSADWCAHPRVPPEYFEPPFEVTLEFPDGTLRKQWCNARLWKLYRRKSVGPDVLQCILMALERWLLEFAEAFPSELDAVLLEILRQSNSGALTAVVAGVATAFPHAAGETLLVLLRSPLCITLDRDRLAHEAQVSSVLSASLHQSGSKNWIYWKERKEADERPHRRRDLEFAMVNLQMGPLARRVHKVLDQHRAELRPQEQQNEEDRLWRLAIHRMDLRDYTISKESVVSPLAPGGGTSPDEDRLCFRLDAKALEPDIKEMADQSAIQFQSMNARLALLMWGARVFSYEDQETYDPAQWRSRLQEARSSDDGVVDSDERVLGEGAPGLVAAVCVRDHWDDLSDDERAWCVDAVCAQVEPERDNRSEFTRMQLGGVMSADRPCAGVLPLLLGKPQADQTLSRVRQALMIGLTHPIDEVRSYTAEGIGRYLWEADRGLALRCVNAIATETTMVERMWQAEQNGPYQERKKVHEIQAEASGSLRPRFLEVEAIGDNAYQSMDPSTWIGAEANIRILTILSQAPSESLAMTAFKRLAQTLVKWWAEDLDGQRILDRPRERNYEIEGELSDLLQGFLLRSSADAASAILQPILNAVNQFPQEISQILVGLIVIEDRKPNTTQFWSLWELFANRVKQATWLPRIDHEHSSGNEVISAIFLGTSWKEETRHWRSLEGHASHVHALFEDLPTSATVLDSYLRFLYHVGEQSLPDAFISVAKRLRQGDSIQMLRKDNTVFLLETLLQRHVYGKPLELKSRSDLREAVLHLLDLLVDNGSSAAFRMRDDFVTPLAVG